ncbi:unnamed protein product, partial [Timema podura]|nr:unnamed protein product [Timema podura]
MADSKYADLPGIAKDQPDVYETDDLPESDQNTNFYELTAWRSLLAVGFLLKLSIGRSLRLSHWLERSRDYGYGLCSCKYNFLRTTEYGPTDIES